MSTPTIILVVGAIIRRDNQVLICQRLAEGSYGSLWEFPGGKVEFGESPAEALVRELQEELNVTVRVDEIFDVASVVVEGRHLVLLFYLCTLLTGEPEPIECQDTRWVTPGELDQYQFPPADENLLRKLQKGTLC